MLEYPNEYIDDLMVRMAHHSTAIEGNTLTQGETKSILLDGYLPRAMNMREMHEVLNYKSFMPFLLEALNDKKEITINFIREIHAILCAEAIEAVPGNFKVSQNMVVGADFTPVPPYLVIPRLEDWRLDLAAMLEAAGTDEAKLLEALCLSHIRFEQIHPFPDGNGRVGRALLVYSAMQCGLPPIVITVQDKQEYINYLNTEDVAGFAAFCQKLIESERQRSDCFNSQFKR